MQDMTLKTPVAFFLAICCVGIAALPTSAEDEGKTPSPVNYMLGTQTFGVRYQFTEETRLVETAEAIHAMGSDILKCFLGRDYANQYAIPQNPDIKTLTELASLEPSYKKVLAMPFNHYFLWAYKYADGNWRDGMSDAEQQAEYNELYELCRYLLKEFDGSQKTFYLGHWEGDWSLIGEPYRPDRNPSPIQIKGMIQWLNVCQKAVDDAKRDTKSSVNLYHYTEVNMNRKRPFYFTLKSYHENLRRTVAEFEEEHGRPPTDGELRRKAIEILNRSVELPEELRPLDWHS